MCVCGGGGEGEGSMCGNAYVRAGGLKEHTAFPCSSCVSAAASSVAVTKPVLPRSLLLSNRSSVVSRGVGGRAT